MKKFNQEQANNEGWCISQVFAHSTLPDGWYRIEKLDIAERFVNDYQAISYVATKAVNGSTYHRNAIDAVDEWNANGYPRCDSFQDAK